MNDYSSACKMLILFSFSLTYRSAALVVLQGLGWHTLVITNGSF